MAVNDKLALARQWRIGTCQEYLPVTEQGHLPSASVEVEPFAAAATNLQHPLREIPGGEWGSLCSRETGGTGLQIVRNFQELISWSQSLYLLISRKALNPFMVTSAPCV